MRLLILAVFALWSVNLSAQTLSEKDETDIRARMEEYFEYTKANKFSEMIDLLYPKLFSLATKEQMMALFSSLETTGIGLHVDDIETKSVEALLEIGDKKYSLANYDIDIRLELLNSQMQSAEIVEALKASFKVQYNADNVEYNEATKMLSFSGNKYVVAIVDPEFDAKEWYFLEFDGNNTELSQMLLGEEAYNKLLEKMK